MALVAEPTSRQGFSIKGKTVPEVPVRLSGPIAPYPCAGSGPAISHRLVFVSFRGLK